MMTRKHFKKLADMMRREAHQIPVGPFDRIVNDLADICKEDNPAFDAAKFMHAIYLAGPPAFVPTESK
jgi:hypothetical protein